MNVRACVCLCMVADCDNVKMCCRGDYGFMLAMDYGVLLQQPTRSPSVHNLRTLKNDVSTTYFFLFSFLF